MQRVRSRTAHILAVENITARQYGARISSNQVKRLTAETVDQMLLPDDVAFAIKTNVTVITTLSVQIDLLEKRLQKKLGGRPEFGLLTSVPGIGQVLATTILLETGPIDRFAAESLPELLCLSGRASAAVVGSGKVRRARQPSPGNYDTTGLACPDCGAADGNSCSKASTAFLTEAKKSCRPISSDNPTLASSSRNGRGASAILTSIPSSVSS